MILRNRSAGNHQRLALVLTLAGLLSGLLASCGILGLSDNSPPTTQFTTDVLQYTLAAGDALCTPYDVGPADTASTCMRPDIKATLSARNLTDSTVRAFRPAGSSQTAFVLSLYRDGDWTHPVAGYDPGKDYGGLACLYGDFFVVTAPGQTGQAFRHLDAPFLEPGAYRLVAEFPNPLCHPGPYGRVAAPGPVTVGVSRRFYMSGVHFAPSLGVDLSKMTNLGNQLYVQTLEAGVGDTAVAPGDLLTANEVEWLADGTKIYSTRDKGPPRFFHLGDTTRLGPFGKPLAGMVRGEIRRILVPPALGAGARGFGGIPPNAALVQEIELLTVQSPS